MSQNNIQKVSKKFYHRVPKDMRYIIDSNKSLLDKWNNLTSLSKNEWICWVTIVKKEETRKKHLKTFKEDIVKGKKRPCCWPGCPHRNPSTQKYFNKN